MVAVSDFSGLASSIWALARAPAIAPMVSLERGMAGLRLLEIKTNRPGFRAFGADSMANRFLGVLRHQLLELGLGGVMFGMGAAGLTKHGCEFGPGIGCAHVHDSDRLDLGRGGSIPNRRGGSPASTQRQNFRSAVSSRCW